MGLLTKTTNLLLSVTLALSPWLSASAQELQPPTPENVKTQAGTRSKRGMAPCLTWVDADSEPKAALLCVHGLGLHNGAYEHFGTQMAKLGVATYAVDVRGFGSWQQADGRGNLDFEDCLKDVEDTLRVIHKVHPRLPVFLLGESMGGAIALHVTSKNPGLVDGLISCVPSGDRFGRTKTGMKVALHFLKGKDCKFDVGTSVVEQASVDGEGKVNEGLKKNWLADPLNRLKLSPMELIEFQRFMNENHTSAKLIADKPVLMLQGCADRLVKPQGTMELFKELTTQDKQLELIPQARHLIFEDSQFNDKALNDKVVTLVTRWLVTHAKIRNTVSQIPIIPSP